MNRSPCDRSEGAHARYEKPIFEISRIPELGLHELDLEISPCADVKIKREDHFSNTSRKADQVSNSVA